MDSRENNSESRKRETGDSLPLDAFRAAFEDDPRGRGLSLERRQAVLDRAMQSPPGRLFAFLPILDFRRAVGAAAAVLLAVGALAVFQPEEALLEGQPEVVDAGKPVDELRVSSSGGKVVLEWSAAASGTHRVVRATNPRELATAPALVVQGNSWVDPETNGAKVVFYRVDDAVDDSL